MSYQIFVSIRDGVPQVSTSGEVPESISVTISGHEEAQGLAIAFSSYVPHMNLSNAKTNTSTN